MKVCVTMKDPDSLGDACREAANESIRGMKLSEAEEDMLIEERCKEAYKFIEKRFMEYGEYLTVEFDTETGGVEAIRR